MSVLIRLAVVLFGFACAIFAGAAIMLAIGGQWVAGEMAARMNESQAGDYDQVADLAGNLFFAFAVIPSLTLLPALGVIIAGEVLRLRSALYYVAAGGAAAAVMPLVTRPVVEGPGMSLPEPRYLAIMATAGFAAGFVYWLIAGRRA